MTDFSNGKGKVWLNVASSHYPVEDFVNLDNHVMMLALDYPLLTSFVPRRNRGMLESYREARKKARFVRHDCRKPLPVPNASVDHILCSHFLEHVYPDEALAILKDFKRALKPGATLHVIVPDLATLVESYVKARGTASPVAADTFVRDSLLSVPQRGSLKFRALEFSGGFGLQHRWMYDRASMLARVRDLGLDLIEVSDTPSARYRLDDGSVHVAARKLSA